MIVDTGTDAISRFRNEIVCPDLKSISTKYEYFSDNEIFENCRISNNSKWRNLRCKSSCPESLSDIGSYKQSEIYTLHEYSSHPFMEYRLDTIRKYNYYIRYEDEY